MAETLIYKTEVHQLVGFAMEALNAIGHGQHEKIYENAMVVDLRQNGISFRQQARFQVMYKDVEVGLYIPDLICFDSIVVDAKNIEQITDHEIGQMINYLKITDLKLGLIVNYRRAELEWRRVVFDRSR